jgi:hypothetical protein
LFEFVDGSYEIQILGNRQILIEAESLRHIADLWAHQRQWFRQGGRARQPRVRQRARVNALLPARAEIEVGKGERRCRTSG